jgi:hypothetical protein
MYKIVCEFMFPTPLELSSYKLIGQVSRESSRAFWELVEGGLEE